MLALHSSRDNISHFNMKEGERRRGYRCRKVGRFGDGRIQKLSDGSYFLSDKKQEI